MRADPLPATILTVPAAWLSTSGMVRLSVLNLALCVAYRVENRQVLVGCRIRSRISTQEALESTYKVRYALLFKTISIRVWVWGVGSY
jgi:hypothetical protein